MKNFYKMNPEKIAKQRARYKDRYSTDPVFRERVKMQSRENYLRYKAKKQNEVLKQKT